MDTPELAERTIGELERLGVPYFVSGSVASGYYGEPRFTLDLDLVVDMDYRNAREICTALRELGYYASEEAAVDAVAHGGMFNVIDRARNFKVDFMLLKDSGYDSLRMDRRRRGHLFGSTLTWIAAPEDVILKKLLFYKEGQSEKHIRDIASMLKVSGDIIDRAYVDHWALRLGVHREWQYLKDRVDGREPGPTV